jgi:hypothetical protein
MTPWYRFIKRLARRECPTLPGCREAPMTAIDLG